MLHVSKFESLLPKDLIINFCVPAGGVTLGSDCEKQTTVNIQQLKFCIDSVLILYKNKLTMVILSIMEENSLKSSTQNLFSVSCWYMAACLYLQMFALLPAAAANPFIADTILVGSEQIQNSRPFQRDVLIHKVCKWEVAV